MNKTILFLLLGVSLSAVAQTDALKAKISKSADKIEGHAEK